MELGDPVLLSETLFDPVPAGETEEEGQVLPLGDAVEEAHCVGVLVTGGDSVGVEVRQRLTVGEEEVEALPESDALLETLGEVLTHPETLWEPLVLGLQESLMLRELQGEVVRVATRETLFTEEGEVRGEWEEEAQSVKDPLGVEK